MSERQNDPEVHDSVSLLSMAKQVLADANEKAEKAKNNAIEEAQAEAKSIVEEAQREADRVTAEAREEAHKLFNDAEAEAERTVRKSEEKILELQERLTSLRDFESEYTSGLLELSKIAASAIGVQLVTPEEEKVEDHDDTFVEEQESDSEDTLHEPEDDMPQPFEVPSSAITFEVPEDQS